MNKITIFKDISDVSNPKYTDVDTVLNIIKSDKYKDLIREIRREPDKNKRNLLKKKLPAICFSGEFSERNDNSLINHSGLICLDFDGYKSDSDLKSFREALEFDKYVMSAFISPSGRGLKVLVKIPESEGDHKKYFDTLQDYFGVPEFDVTSKNISRVCYVSHDPDIYVRKDSAVWEYLPEVREVKVHKNPVIETAVSEDRSVRILMDWWARKYGMIDGQRSNNVFILAKSFNEFGINKSTAEAEIFPMAQSDFPVSEIRSIIRSAYRDTSVFGSKKFNDLKKKEMEFNDDSPVVFWAKSDKGRVYLDQTAYISFLTNQGFRKTQGYSEEDYRLVEIKDNFIKETSEIYIKDLVLNYVKSHNDKLVYNFFIDQTKLFKYDYLTALKTIEVKMVKDTRDVCFLYYKNTAVKVFRDKIKEIPYNKLDGYVWEDQVINREFSYESECECDYKTFISNLSGNNSSLVTSLESTIGYLLSSYKDPAYSPAVILNDSSMTESPEGGTGKGLFVNGISQMKKVAYINGKTIDLKRQFSFQSITNDDQIISFDDVQKNFPFEQLFSVITEGINIEKKGKTAYQIPFKDSPKIVITTNYTIRGKGNSHERRRWEVELKQHYSKTRTPVDEFGKRFFDEWNDQEWLMFDNYMISNLQLYLSRGLVSANFDNLALRKLASDTSYDFIEWVGLILESSRSEKIRYNKRLHMNDLYSDFIETYPDYSPRGKLSISRNMFYSWLDSYGKFDHKIKNQVYGRDKLGKFIEFYTGDKQKKITDNLDF